jgi:hypothetical protein
MYDAKENEELSADNYILEGKSVSDRSYFAKVQSECIMNLASSYVPKERYINIE